MVLPMSGTSMAAPYVAGVAAKMKDLNPALTPVQLKEILMGTVDKKDWLKTKVISSGVVNADRAYMASEKSKSMTVAAAIAASIQSVADQKEVSAPKRIFKVNSTTQEMREFANDLVF
jgi:cell wall-associated protease